MIKPHLLFLWMIAILFITGFIGLLITLAERNNPSVKDDFYDKLPIAKETLRIVFYERPYCVYSFSNSDGTFYLAVNCVESNVSPTIIKVK